MRSALWPRNRKSSASRATLCTFNSANLHTSDPRVSPHRTRRLSEQTQTPSCGPRPNRTSSSFTKQRTTGRTTKRACCSALKEHHEASHTPGRATSTLPAACSSERRRHRSNVFIGGGFAALTHTTVSPKNLRRYVGKFYHGHEVFPRGAVQC